MTHVITAIGAVFDTSGLIVYDDKGKSHTISQTTPGIEQLVNKMIPQLNTPGGKYTFDLDDLLNIDHNTDFHDFQKRNSLGIKFKRIARSILNVFTNPQPATEQVTVPEGSYGSIPPEKTKESIDSQIEKQRNAAAENIRNAPPITARTLTKPDDKEGLVAVIRNEIIPDADKLRSYLAHGRKINNYRGLENLILRLSVMIKNRQHTILDVLQFLERGDLPITDRGDILGYKRLYSQNGGEHFVDPHTRTVTQRAGDFVCMPVEKVDRNRSRECSYGLHVGRRDYMGSFNGDTLFLVMIAPEDLIAVPHGDPNKVRVCGYHLLTPLSDKLAQLVYSRKPFADEPEGQELLAKAVSNGFGSPERIVQIGTNKDLEISDAPEGLIGKTVNRLPEGISGTKDLEFWQKSRNKKLKNVEPPTDDGKKVESVSPSKALSRVQKALGKAKDAKIMALSKPLKKPTPTKQTRAEKVREMMATFDQAKGADRKLAAQAMLGFKKKAKVSWDILGISDTEVAKLTAASTMVTRETATAPASVKNARQQKAAELFALYNDRANDTQTRHAAAKELVALKKQAKIGWDRLAIREIDAQTITEFAASMPSLPSVGTKKAKPAAKPKATPAKIDLSTAPSEMEQRQQGINRTANKRQTQAREHFTAKHWQHLVNLKRKSKVSWAALGFSQEEINEIKLHIGD